MKSLNVLITTLVLGSSSLALAEPIVRDHRSDDRYEDRSDDRFGDRFGDRDRFQDRHLDRDERMERFHRNRMMPVRLADDLEVNMREPAFIQLGQGGIRQLRFDSDEGHAYIHSIVLVFSNGAQQSLDIRQRVTSRSMPLTIDIDPRATGIYIYGKTRGRGSLDIVGLRR